VEGAGSVSGNRERNVFQKHSPKHPAPNLKFSIEFYSVLVLIVAISFATLFLTIYYPGTEHSSTSPLSQPLSTSASTARKTERDRRRASSSLSKPPAPSFKPLAKDDEADDEPEDEKLPDKTLKYMDSAKKPVDLFLPDTKTSKDQQNGDCSEEWRDNFLPEKRPLIYLREAGILNHESSQRTSYEPMRKNLLPENGQAVMVRELMYQSLQMSEHLSQVPLHKRSMVPQNPLHAFENVQAMHSLRCCDIISSVH